MAARIASTFGAAGATRSAAASGPGYRAGTTATVPSASSDEHALDAARHAVWPAENRQLVVDADRHPDDVGPRDHLLTDPDLGVGEV